MNSADKDIYGLIGHPLEHSFSKKYFENKFHNEGSNHCSYQEFPLRHIKELTEVCNKLPNLKGFNVTIPYKETIIPFLDELSEEARRIGAVNTVKCVYSTTSERRLIGYNTDVIGFTETIKIHIKKPVSHAFVLGTGGASKAIRYALKEMEISTTIVSRNAKENQIGYDKLGGQLGGSNVLIINTTPLGMYPKIESAPPIPYDLLNESHVLYDLIYNPEQTLFLKQGMKRGCQIINGLEMLHLQAEASWKIWNT